MGKQNITLGQLIDAMREYNRTVAPGSECSAWGDFVEDYLLHFEGLPWHDAESEDEPAGNEFGPYWEAVSDGS